MRKYKWEKRLLGKVIVPGNYPGWALPNTAELARFHIAKGIHSGIPWCCVYYYNAVAPHVNPKFIVKNAKLYNEAIKKGLNCGYMPCPNCLKNKTFVMINMCCTEKTCKREFETMIPEWPNDRPKTSY